MKIYLDDERPTPPDWTAARTAEEVIQHLEAGRVEELSLDHDLGSAAAGSGDDVLLWIEESVALRGFVPPLIWVHATDAPAKARLQAAIAAIDRMVARRKRAATQARAVGGEVGPAALFPGGPTSPAAPTPLAKPAVGATESAPSAPPDTGFITEQSCAQTYLELFGKAVPGAALMLGLDRATTAAMFRKACLSLAGSKRSRPKTLDIRKELERLYPPKTALAGAEGAVDLKAPPKYRDAFPFEMRHLDNLHTRRAFVGVNTGEPPPLPEWARTPEALSFVSTLFARNHCTYRLVHGRNDVGKLKTMRVDLEPDDFFPENLGKSIAHMLMTYGRRNGWMERK